MGALQLFCALFVTSGITYAETFSRKRFKEFRAFLLRLFSSLDHAHVKTLDLILDNGPTHAPKQLAPWIASLKLHFRVRLFWLPTYASWLDQVEIIFSKVTRDVLVPNDFRDKRDLSDSLMMYFKEMNKAPKPIHWSYTKANLEAKFSNTPSHLAA
jgi:hypothetical protein